MNAVSVFPMPRAAIARAVVALAACGQSAGIVFTRLAGVEAAPASADNIIYANVVGARTESNLGFHAAGKVVERFDDSCQTDS
ncbi:hypothetical protein P3T23_005112 [Paraburkholderia sp. GAS448]|uniref:hypothetical protein n=1 Tax=Paraburkholderia sp. GAS448 TaxID=3035136 RepID=UPI003D1B8E79